MAQMATMGKVKTHEPSMYRHKRLIHLQVGRATAEGLDIDTPFCGIEMKRLESALLAKKLDLVNMLISSVVSGSGSALAVPINQAIT